MTFQVGSSVDIVPYTGLVTLGMVMLTAISEGTIPMASSITISYKSNVIEWLPTLGSMSGNNVGGMIGGIPFAVGKLPPNLSVAPPVNNSLTLNFTANTTFAAGDTLYIEGVTINNPPNFSGSHETGYKAVCSAASAAFATSPITFTPGFAPVARFD
jgi:hypothetical protein